MATVSPLGWYLLGVTLGPGVGILDRALLDLIAPILAAAVGCVAARAAAELATPNPDPEPWSATGVLEAAGALLIPAALLVAAVRWLMTPSLEEWRLFGPVIATVAAALALAGTRNPRRVTIGAFAFVSVALIALLVPHNTVTALKHGARSIGYGIGGAAVCAVIAARLSGARRSCRGPSPPCCSPRASDTPAASRR